VMGGTLSLRNNEADHIEVEVDEPENDGGTQS
jgi:Fe2+ transport system protein FeoA